MNRPPCKKCNGTGLTVLVVIYALTVLVVIYDPNYEKKSEQSAFSCKELKGRMVLTAEGDYVCVNVIKSKE